MATTPTKTPAKGDDPRKTRDEDDKITVSDSPTPNAVLKAKGREQSAKNPDTIPYVEIVKEVVQVPNTYPAQTYDEPETSEEAALRLDKGETSVEETGGLERDPQHVNIIHTEHDFDRIETEAEKVARKGDAGVNLGQAKSFAPGEAPGGSRRLAAEQAAGREALAARNASKGKEATAKADRDERERKEREAAGRPQTPPAR